MNPVLQFDIAKVDQLAGELEETIVTIKELLPKVNWNSQKAVKQYFLDNYWLTLPDTKIVTLQEVRDQQEHDSELFDDLTGLIEYYKTLYKLKNYVRCIQRHHQQGKVYLREINGEWRMPNKQPVPTDSSITQCLTAL